MGQVFSQQFRISKTALLTAQLMHLQRFNFVFTYGLNLQYYVNFLDLFFSFFFEKETIIDSCIHGKCSSSVLYLILKSLVVGCSLVVNDC